MAAGAGASPSRVAGEDLQQQGRGQEVANTATVALRPRWPAARTHAQREKAKRRSVTWDRRQRLRGRSRRRIPSTPARKIPVPPDACTISRRPGLENSSTVFRTRGQ